MSEAASSPQRPVEIPGWWVIVAMFTFGTCATALIFIYWEMHTRPFRPLTEAVGREFRHSLPKVEGGRNKGGPMTLRVALRVPFKPVKGLEETEAVVRRVVELSKQHADISRFEILEVYLIQRAPEQAVVTAAFQFPVATVLNSSTKEAPSEDE
ncbi:MAG: hypothetical protein Q8K78_11740 [Planctomycetaceae bacterium]|nr:hypothetical protein [Planctomycetaceae bacterium]